MTIELTTVDANRYPIKGARIESGLGVSMTDSRGVVTYPVAVTTARPLRLKVTHPSYVTEEVVFAEDLRGGTWNNSLVTREVAGPDVKLQIQLGCLDTAPTLLVEDRDLAAQFARQKDPVAALTFHRDPITVAYREQWLPTQTIRVAKSTLLPTGPVPDTATGWDRFATDSVMVNLTNAGRFFWLTYPQQPPSSGLPGFAVAVWSPTLPDERPVEALDIVVLFSPTTAGKPQFRTSYPFGLIQDGGHIYQPYMLLGKRYVTDEFYYAYQLAARGNQAILVMPICAAGDWGPFRYGEGLLRLLREVAVFVHAQYRTSRLAEAHNKDKPGRLEGASTRHREDYRVLSSDFGRTPQIGKVAVSFFSNGYEPVSTLLGGAVGWPLDPRRFGSELWGVAASGGADPSKAWDTSWLELWDMDGYHPKPDDWVSGEKPYLDVLKSWYGDQNRGRVIRLCHSGGRKPPDPTSFQHPLYTQFRKTTPFVAVIPPPKSRSAFNYGTAKEVQGENWSVVMLDNAYMLNADPAVVPKLGKERKALEAEAARETRSGGDYNQVLNTKIDFEGHQATAKVAFSYAVTNSKVGSGRQPFTETGRQPLGN
jgi:hypothetical protein